MQTIVTQHLYVRDRGWICIASFELHEPQRKPRLDKRVLSDRPQKASGHFRRAQQLGKWSLLRRVVTIPFSHDGGSIELTVPLEEYYEIVALHSK